MNSGAKVKGKRMLLQSEFQSVVLWKKNFLCKICLAFACPRFRADWILSIFQVDGVLYSIQDSQIYISFHRIYLHMYRRKNIILISSILTETMHTNTNWLVQNNIQWQNCYKNSDAFVFIHCKVFVFVWQSFQILSRSKVFACLRRL